MSKKKEPYRTAAADATEITMPPIRRGRRGNDNYFREQAARLGLTVPFGENPLHFMAKYFLEEFGEEAAAADTAEEEAAAAADNVAAPAADQEQEPHHRHLLNRAEQAETSVSFGAAVPTRSGTSL